MSLEAKKKLKEMVENGLAIEIYKIEEAIFLLKEIGNHADELNSKGYGGVFGVFQDTLKARLIIYTSRLFEASSRNRLRSLPHIVRFIENHNNELDIIERRQFVSALNNLGLFDRTLIGLPYTELTRVVTEHILNIMPNQENYLIDELSNSLYKIKYARDKIFVHNEIIVNKTLDEPLLKDVKNLLEFSKNVTIAIGWGYLSTYYGTKNDFLLTFEANFSSSALSKLFKQAGINTVKDKV